MTAIMAVTRNLRTLTDGTVRLQVDIEPNDAVNAMQMFGVPSTPIGIAQLDAQYTVGMQQKKMVDEEQGYLANQLHRHGFFRSAAVARVLGSDSAYQQWTRKQPCVVSGSVDSIEYAHVRRVSRGSGTGIKPEFSGVPLRSELHRIQHQKGESGLLTEYFGQTYTEDQAKAWFDKQSDKNLAGWCKMKFLQKFDAESTKDLDFSLVAQWARDHEIDKWLPREIQQLA